MVLRWTLYDPNTSTTLTFAMNPNEGGTPPLKKTITYQATAAGGRTLAFQGRPDVQTIDISGTVLTEEDYQFFVDWYDVQNQMLLTDDLGREFWVVVIEFTATRVRAAHHPWKHTYTLKALILDNP